ncbi:ribonuclease P protein component [Pseudoflavonifractor phocaeensis]|uniref:ribonuclease P protein component n=1 Tax=Pseudoflavonifractor phocaeensis TaxID=1870988 RepID=UPI001956AB2C|nr:ribonuclease P protein component [Pseudoflavonifractor phocaeensis]MBM6939064.1 ribonuclease P protein component [Pseudoflavonifractor phocaeensis]
MKNTCAIKQNHIFRRLYSKGKSAVSPCVAVYCRKNGRNQNRLGITVGAKVGKAVVRNRVRRRIREAYRIHEDRLVLGYDIVVVARTRCAFCRYGEVERHLLRCLDRLHLRTKDAP